MSEKVMLPESMMADEEELRAWLSRAFQAALLLPPKTAKTTATKTARPKTNTRPKAKTTPKPKTKIAARRAAAPAKKRSTAKTRAHRR
jgi:hypothetical protein